MKHQLLWDSGAIVIGCRHNTQELIERLMLDGKEISGIITISEATAKKNRVPSWVDLTERFGKKIKIYVAQS